MRLKTVDLLLNSALMFIAVTGAAQLATKQQQIKEQEEPVCVENSPERRGEFGCSIVEKKPLPPDIKEPTFWHIDKFGSAERAKSGVGPTSIAFEAHGFWWLMTVGPSSTDHHGGQHVAEMKISPLPEAASYSMMVISAYIPAGMTSRVHFHSGVEAFYAVEGDGCLQTKERAYKMTKGDTLVIPTGITMRFVANGTEPRRDFAILVYDSSKPPVTRMPMDTAWELASCGPQFRGADATK
jgi:quercetin dioxygenase-like cupin family protein